MDHPCTTANMLSLTDQRAREGSYMNTLVATARTLRAPCRYAEILKRPRHKEIIQ